MTGEPTDLDRWADQGPEATPEETEALDRWYEALLRAEQILVEARPSSVRYSVLDHMIEIEPAADPAIIARVRSARRSAAAWERLSRLYSLRPEASK